MTAFIYLVDQSFVVFASYPPFSLAYAARTAYRLAASGYLVGVASASPTAALTDLSYATPLQHCAETAHKAADF